MKLSKYNVSYEAKEYVLVFNTLSSSIVKISHAFWKYLNSENLNNQSDPSVKRLLDMGILVNSDIDALNQYKYWYYKTAFESRIPFLYIAPTMQCNFNCFYCFEDGHKSYGKMEKTVSDRLIQFLKTYGKDTVNIVWFGGEPMLGFDRILDICEGLRIANIKYSSSMITNGSLFSDDNVGKLELLNLAFIQVSMDGVGAIHDRRRCFAGGQPTFSLVINNIRRVLTKTSIPIVIQVTVDRENSTAYDDMVNYCRDTFPQYVKNRRLRVGYNSVQNRTGFDTSGSCFSQEEIMNCELKRMRDGDKTNVTIPCKAAPCMYRAPWHFAIDSQGYIYKCLEHLGNSCECVGSLKNDYMSLKALANAAFQEDAFSDEECVNCSVFPICGGGCPLDRIRRSNGESRILCSRYKEGLTQLLPVIYEKIRFQSHE